MEDVCPQCGEEKQNLTLHWQHNSTCEFPSINEGTHHLLAVVILSTGSLCSQSTNPWVRYDSVSRAELEWLGGELDWLATSITEVSRGEDEYYRLKTRRHPDLYRLEDVQPIDGESRRVPPWLELTRTTGRTFYALVGRLDDHLGLPKPIINRSAIPAEEDARLARFFEPFAPLVYEKRVVLNAARDWFEFIGWEPVEYAATSWPRRALYEGENIAQCDDCGGQFVDLQHHQFQVHKGSNQ